MAIACAYCNSQHATPAEVRQCWQDGGQPDVPIADDELPPLPAMLPAPQQLLAWRQGLTARCRLLGEEEAAALDTAIGGASFAEICERIAGHGPEDEAPERAATYVRGWIDGELVQALRAASASVGNTPDRSA